MSNEITAYFKGTTGVAESVYQYDYGMILNIDGLDLSSSFDVHFENYGSTKTVSAVGSNNKVSIPNRCLSIPGMVTVYIYTHTGSHDGETAYVATFQVVERARPDDDVTEDTEISNAEAIAQLNSELNHDVSRIESALDINISSLDTRLNARIDNIIGGSASSAEEVIDARLGADDSTVYGSLGTAIRTQVSDIKANIDNNIFGKGFDVKWERGSISYIDGQESVSAQRIRSELFYFPKGSTITVDSSNYEFWIFKYSIVDGTYSKVMSAYAVYGDIYTDDEDSYLRVVMKLSNSTADIPTADVYTVASHLVASLYGIVRRIYDNTTPTLHEITTPVLNMVVGKGIDASTGRDTTNPRRACSQNYISGGDYIEVSINTAYDFIIQHYSNGTTSAITSWSKYYKINNPSGTYRFVIRKSTDANLTDSDLESANFTVHVVYKSKNLEHFLAKKLDNVLPQLIGKFLYVDTNGNVIGQEIDFDENAPVHARVGTYNIGHFSEGNITPGGTTENAINFRQAIAKMCVSLLSITEDDTYFDADHTMTPKDMVFDNWKYYSIGALQSYSCNGFASDYLMKNIGTLQFSGTTRYAYYCDIDIGSKSCHAVSAHLDFNDITTRRSQIQALITHCASYDRCIIMGDFNPFNYTNGVYNDDGNDKTVYETDYALWTTAGYKLANAGFLGVIPTIIHSGVSGWQDLPSDNIIVTSNIEIRNVGVIQESYMNDHKPLWADLVIY